MIYIAIKSLVHATNTNTTHFWTRMLGPRGLDTWVTGTEGKQRCHHSLRDLSTQYYDPTHLYIHYFYQYVKILRSPYLPYPLALNIPPAMHRQCCFSLNWDYHRVPLMALFFLMKNMTNKDLYMIICENEIGKYEKKSSSMVGPSMLGWLMSQLQKLGLHTLGKRRVEPSR